MVVKKHLFEPLSSSDNNTTNSFDPYTLSETVFLAIFIAISSLATVLVNTVVLLAFYLNTVILKPRYYLIISLAISDFMTGLFSAPLYGLYLLTGKWPSWLGHLMCDIWVTFDYSNIRTSQLTIFFITLDRYLSIKYPIKYLKHHSGRKVIGVIAFTWFYPAFIHITLGFVVELLDADHHNNGICILSYLEHPIYAYGYNFSSFWIPFFIMVVLYVEIYIITRRLQKKLRKKLSTPGGKSYSETPQKKLDKNVNEHQDEDESAASTQVLPSEKDSQEIKAKETVSSVVQTMFPPMIAQCRTPLVNIHQRTNNSELAGEVDRTRKTMRNIFCILGAYTICYIPYHMYVVLEIFQVCVNHFVVLLIYWLPYLNALVNAFAYSYSNDVLKNSLKRVLKFDMRRI